MTTAHHNGHEHEFEPQHGLPEALPAGERLLWQGSPVRSRIAREVFHLRAVALYFLVILAMRFVFHFHDTGSVAESFGASTWLVPIFATGLILLWTLAHLVANTTVYTITDRRVVLRVGIVLSLTFNIPLSRVQAAQVRRVRDGGGDLVIELVPGDKIAWAHLWPHVRPWRMAWPQPMLRGLASVDEPARVLREAWLAQHPEAAPQGAPSGARAHSDADSLPVRTGDTLSSGRGRHVAAH